jgi:beta-lactamase class D
LHGKTGSAGGWGWYVGWVSKGTRTLVFARLMKTDDSQPTNVSTGEWARNGLIADFPQLIGSAAQ